MSATEPILRDDDLQAWETWRRVALLRAEEPDHRRRVDRAREIVDRALSLGLSACVMWSGGKDSTALAHLIRAHMGISLQTFSEKDDLDFPEEEQYIKSLAADHSIDLRVLRPEVSPAAWLAENGASLSGYDDLHSRAAELSRACFYRMVEEASNLYGLTFLGLRAGESRGRAMNYATRGSLYRRMDGRWTCSPIASWEGVDVYAYLLSRGIELLPLYRCIAFMHRDEPWRVRKSWWVPGSSARLGGAAWLRRYYPSLFDRLASWIPASRSLA